MTQTDHANGGGAGNCPTEDRHRIHVLQEQCIGAELLQVAAHLEEDRNGAQPAHDAADSDRVGDRLA